MIFFAIMKSKMMHTNGVQWASPIHWQSGYYLAAAADMEDTGENHCMEFVEIPAVEQQVADLGVEIQKLRPVEELVEELLHW